MMSRSPLRPHPQLRWDPHSFALWCLGVRPERTPSFDRPPPFSTYGVLGLATSTPPASLGRPPVPTDQPASSLVHWAHSHTPRFLRGFSDLPHSLFGSATEAIATSRSRRLESGSARIPLSFVCKVRANPSKSESPQFSCLF